jgi:hypothetical protein
LFDAKGNPNHGKVVQLGCKHLFHKDCIETLEKCPLCRTAITKSTPIEHKSETVSIEKLPPMPNNKYNYFKRYIEMYNNYNDYKEHVSALIGSRYNINNTKLRNIYNRKEQVNTRKQKNSRKRKTRRSSRK